MKIRLGHSCFLLVTACMFSSVSFADSDSSDDRESIKSHITKKSHGSERSHRSKKSHRRDKSHRSERSSGSIISSGIVADKNTGIVAQPKKISHFWMGPIEGDVSPVNIAQLPDDPNLKPECPDRDSPGLVDIIAVPEEKSESITIVGLTPREDPYYFTVTTLDSRIAAIVGGTGSVSTQVLVPANRTYSNPYTVQGVAMGETRIRHSSQYNSAFYLPVGIWKVDGIFDFNDLGKGDVCYYAGEPKTLLYDSDIDAKSTCGKEIKSVAADGVSRLLMRIKSGVKGAACYRIVSEQPASDHGQIEPSNSDDMRTVPANGAHWAFSTYIPPEEFELKDAVEREVVMDFAFTPENPGTGNFTRTNTLNVTKKIIIRRPPVLLVHGIWGSSSSWGDVFTSREPAGGWDIHAINYSNSAAFGNVTGAVGSTIRTMLKSARETDSMAVAKVDVIAHSMGNLVTRRYMHSDMFQWDDNFLEGNIRKLVSLTSPHWGSKLANLLVNLNNNFSFLKIGVIEYKLDGDIHGGGVCSIAENSPDLDTLGDVPYVKSEAITAAGGKIGDFHGPLKGFRALFSIADEITHLNPYIFTTANDGVVDVESQEGSLPVTVNLAGEVHSKGAANPGQGHVTGSYAAALNAYYDLDGDGSAVFDTDLTGIDTDRNGVPDTGGRPGFDAAAYLIQCQVGGPMRPVAMADTSGVTATTESKEPPSFSSAGVTVVSPIEGSTFEPGSIIPIEVTVDPLLLATNVLVVARGINETIYMTGPPFTGSLTIPSNLSGPVALLFLVQDAAVDSVGNANFSINIVSTDMPTELAVSPKRHYLNIPMTRPVLSRTISVRGTYADSSKRDLSDAVTGTSYSSVDPAIATVTVDGVVSAVAAGTTYIVIDNQGVKAYSKVVVEDPAVNEVPVDNTAQVSFSARGFRRDQETGRYVQQVVITNNGSLPLSLPLRLVITDLPAGVKLANAFGDTQVILPLGSAYVAVDSNERSFVSPGNTASATLEFLNFQGVPITYTPRLFTAIDP